jgi:carbon monoxide dehydrogenase subunit G
MKLAGDYLFAAPQALVWDALLDPKVLASVLPGCERLDLTGENQYEGQLQIKVGPVQGSFLGKVKLRDLNPPTSYSMEVDGRGAPGFVKATAKISLATEGESTRFSYDADAQVGGKIASVGQRLMESSARAIIKQSLEGLNAAVVARSQAAHAAAVVPTAAAGGPSQLHLAAGVAREVAKDLIPAGAPRLIAVLVLILLAIMLLRVIF